MLVFSCQGSVQWDMMPPKIHTDSHREPLRDLPLQLALERHWKAEKGGLPAHPGKSGGICFFFHPFFPQIANLHWHIPCVLI